MQALEKLYRAAITDHGSPRHDLSVPGHRLMTAVINRVLGLGALAVEREQWWAVPVLVLRRPDAELFRSGHYTNWVRHTTTEASRAGVLQTTTSLGQPVKIAFLEHTLSDVGALACINAATPEKDVFRDRLAQFDALATIAVWGLAPGDCGQPYYPWHRAYEARRYEPALVRLVTDEALRQAVYPGTNRELAELLARLEEFSGGGEFARFDGGWPYMAGEIRLFIERNLA